MLTIPPLQWNCQHIVALATGLDEMGDEDFDDEGLFVERAARLVEEEDVQTISAPAGAAGDGLHGNGDIGGVVRGGNGDRRLLHDVGEALVEDGAYLDGDDIALNQGAQALWRSGFALAQALAGRWRHRWLRAAHQANANGVGLVRLHAHRRFDDGGGCCCVLLFAQEEILQTLQPRPFFWPPRFLHVAGRWVFRSDQGQHSGDALAPSPPLLLLFAWLWERSTCRAGRFKVKRIL